MHGELARGAQNQPKGPQLLGQPILSASLCQWRQLGLARLSDPRDRVLDCVAILQQVTLLALFRRNHYPLLLKSKFRGRGTASTLRCRSAKPHCSCAPATERQRCVTFDGRYRGALVGWFVRQKLASIHQPQEDLAVLGFFRRRPKLGRETGKPRLPVLLAVESRQSFH